MKTFFDLQVLDVLTTIIGNDFGLKEGNPEIAVLFPTLGFFFGLLVGKILFVSVLLFIILRICKNPRWNFVNSLFGILILWNSSLILLRVFHVV